MQHESLWQPASMAGAVAGRRQVLALLCSGIMIVAADKAIFAFAGVRIMQELALTPAQFGQLGSAFFLLYSLSGVAVGFLANRIPARLVLLALASVWALCQLGVAFSSSLLALLLFRVLLGAGAGPSTAVIQHACFKWFAPRQRTLPAAIINAGLMGGILLSAVTLPWLIQHVGWRQAYLLLAGISLLWALLWALFGREGTEAATEADAANLPASAHNRYRHLIGNRSFLLTTLLCFCGYLVSGLGFSWHPAYLEKGLGLSPLQAGFTVMVVMGLVIPTVLGVSALSQRWVRQGRSSRLALVGLPVACCVVGGSALCLLGLHSLPLAAKLLLSGLGFILFNVQQNFGLVICGEICPPSQRAAVLATHVALTTSAGLLAPMLAGQMVQAAGNVIGIGYENCLQLVGALVLLASLAALLAVDPERSRQQLAALRRQAPAAG